MDFTFLKIHDGNVIIQTHLGPYKRHSHRFTNNTLTNNLNLKNNDRFKCNGSGGKFNFS